MKITIGGVEQEVKGQIIVCPKCGGHGTVLRASIAQHAYTEEEFAEFSDEEREAYFTRGGAYDEKCPRCKGRNVVEVPDEKALTPKQLRALRRDEAEERAYQALCRMEQEAGC